MDSFYFVNGFLLASVQMGWSYFISPLRINGSALESMFSVLKHTQVEEICHCLITFFRQVDQQERFSCKSTF